jgi:hypothetical protein
VLDFGLAKAAELAAPASLAESSPDGKVMAVDVKAGTGIETGAPKPMFETRVVYDPRLTFSR